MIGGYRELKSPPCSNGLEEILVGTGSHDVINLTGKLLIAQNRRINKWTVGGRKRICINPKVKEQETRLAPVR